MSVNVLIVDDSAAIRAVIKKIISISGFRMNICLEAANGLMAWEQLQQNCVDVIVTGIDMPVMTGLELLLALNRDPAYQHIPAIVVSTDACGRQRTQASQRGAKGFIQKPFFPEDIRKTLLEVIG
jgi:two-component system chemotaxis response regulator CheY